MSFLDERKVQTREKRVSTLSNFDGTLEGLRDESQGAEIKQRIRTLTQISYDEILYAVGVLSKIKDAAVVVHGAIGCSASGIFFNQELPYHWYSTNLNERDTILGGDERLRAAVTRANNETSPKVIFIVGTPVVAINNDDVNSIILELEDELDVKIISIYTDGFKSKTPLTGYDIVAHSLLKYVVDKKNIEEKEKQNFINVVSFSENAKNLVSVLGILKKLGIAYNLLPQFSRVENIEKAGAAKATIVLNPEEGGYLAQQLEEVFHVPYVKTPVPVGLEETRRFITRIAKVSSTEDAARELIEEQENALEKKIREQALAGKNVFLETSLPAAVGFAALVEKIGGTVEGFAFADVDLENRENLEKLSHLKGATPVIVANGQLYEKANLISEKEIDYYIGSGENISFAAEQGAIPVSTLHIATYGYEGIRQLLDAISSAKRFPSGTDSGFYKASWLKKKSNWYVKQEVK